MIYFKIFFSNWIFLSIICSTPKHRQYIHNTINNYINYNFIYNIWYIYIVNLYNSNISVDIVQWLNFTLNYGVTPNNVVNKYPHNFQSPQTIKARKIFSCEVWPQENTHLNIFVANIFELQDDVISDIAFEFLVRCFK